MKRIQRQRTKGWRMPAAAEYVGRPSLWGNWWIIGQPCDGSIDPTGRVTAATAVHEFRRDVVQGLATDGRPPETLDRSWLEPLRGRDLACYCPLDQPCHADVLLELANA